MPLFKKRKNKSDHTGRPTVDDFEALGKQVAALYDHINPDRKGLYRTAFLKGVVSGLGGVIGATLVIALLAWILALVGHVPLIGPLTDSVRQTIEEKR